MCTPQSVQEKEDFPFGNAPFGKRYMGLHGDQHVASTVPLTPIFSPPTMMMGGLAGPSESTILRCILLHSPHKSGALVFKLCMKHKSFPVILRVVSRGTELQRPD